MAQESSDLQTRDNPGWSVAWRELPELCAQSVAAEWELQVDATQAVRAVRPMSYADDDHVVCEMPVYYSGVDAGSSTVNVLTYPLRPHDRPYDGMGGAFPSPAWSNCHQLIVPRP